LKIFNHSSSVGFEFRYPEGVWINTTTSIPEYVTNQQFPF